MPAPHLAALSPDPTSHATPRGPRNAARTHTASHDPSFSQALADSRRNAAPDNAERMPTSKPAHRTEAPPSRHTHAQRATGDAKVEAKMAVSQDAEPCTKDHATSSDAVPASPTLAPDVAQSVVQARAPDNTEPPVTPAVREALSMMQPDLATAHSPVHILAAYSSAALHPVSATDQETAAHPTSLSSQPGTGMWSDQTIAEQINSRHATPGHPDAQAEGDALHDGRKGDANAHDAATSATSIPASPPTEPRIAPLPFAAHVAPLAVSQSATVAPASMAHPVPLAHVPFTIATMASEGTRQFDIRLDPPNLGRIDVTLAVDAEGGIRTHIAVERPETLQLLRNDAHRLDQALSDAGLTSDPAGPAFSLRNSNDDARHRAPQRDPASGIQTAPSAASDTARPPLPAPRRLMSAASRLDLTL